MKQLLYFTSLLILCFNPLLSLAQLNHFVYLQTENKQPFYVKMDKKIFNSTVSGYLIIPKLQDGIYNFSIGFLNSENKEYDFSCSINNKDAGYLVKDFSDKGWGLFNLQSLQVVMSGSKEQDVAQINKTDAFSNLLSNVVNDPAIKQQNSVKQEVKAQNMDQQILQEAKKVETVPIIAQADIKKDTTAIMDTTVSQKPILLSIVKKQGVLHNQDGMNITYVDVIDGIQDTIIILIPNEQTNNKNLLKPTSNEFNGDTSLKKEINLSKNDEESSSQKLIPDSTQEEVNKKKSNEIISPSKDKEEVKDADKNFLEIDLSKPANPQFDSNTITKKGESSSSQVTDAVLKINSDCKSAASEEDFLKLRKKMAAAKSDEEMISNAKRTFKSKCFTTDQVKNLGVLFLKDADRYNFFDVAYPFVSDTNNYKQLEDQLTDAYYKSRFHAMIRH